MTARSPSRDTKSAATARRTKGMPQLGVALNWVAPKPAPAVPPAGTTAPAGKR